MPNHLSLLGIFHTAISVIALLTAFYALFRRGKINPSDRSGKLYIALTVIACVSALPIMKTGHFTPGHYVAIIILILLPPGIYANRIFGRLSGYFQIFIMSTTLVLSCIPAIVETLTRLPMSGPIANSPNAPIVQNATNVLFVLYIAGVIYQMVKYRNSRKAIPTAEAQIRE